MIHTKEILDVIDTAVDGFLVDLIDEHFKVEHKTERNKINIYIQRETFKLSEVSFCILNLQAYFKYKYKSRFTYEIIYRNNHYTKYHTFPFYNYKTVKAIKLEIILYDNIR